MTREQIEVAQAGSGRPGLLTTSRLALQLRELVTSGAGSWKPMPPEPVAPANTPVCSYELDGEIDDNGYLDFYLIPGRETWMPNDNETMNMNVHHDCIIILTLSNSLSWYFPDSDPAIVLGTASSASTPPETRYSALTPAPGPGKCTRVWFYAQKAAPTTTPNYDSIVICVALDHKLADGTISTVPLVLMIDPGIKNPGDDPL